MSQPAALLLLFVVLPLVVTPIVVAIVVRRSPDLPPEYRTSWLLEHGEPVSGELVSWKNKGPFLLDGRPMVAFVVLVAGERLDFTQSVPRHVVGELSEGMTLDVRVSPDRRAAAMILPE
ncbi:MAG: hypothetical protein H0W70_07795 [Actinobacteria bacterium]|nr:hypothetical protein [Actinomycetota bacterium]